MRIPLSRLSQGIRTFASQPAARTVAHRIPTLPLHHGPSQRILSKAAAAAHHGNSQVSSFPILVRDSTSYGALGALTSGVAFLIYCSDADADLMDLFAV